MARAGSKREYGNESISSLKGADRVRKRPGVIFGSDGLEDASMLYLKFFPMPLTRPEKGLAT